MKTILLAGIATLSITAAHADFTASHVTPDAACYSATPPTGPAAIAHGCDLRDTSTTEFQQGYAARESWEQWFASLSGEYKAGAYWWSGQRSQANPPACETLGGNASQGCLDAKARLDVSDQRRRLSPAYKQGWNSYTAPQVATVASDAPETGARPVEQTQPEAPSSDNVVCSELAKMAHRPGCGAPNPLLQRMVAPFFPSLAPAPQPAPQPAQPVTADMPNYNVSAYCHANPMPFGTVQDCVNLEYIDRSSVLYKWNGLSTAVKLECVGAANESGSYATLFACVLGHTGF
jgi:hypothetical protein